MSLRFKFGKASGGEPLPILPIQLLDEDGNLLTDEESAIVDTGSDGTIFLSQFCRPQDFAPIVSVEICLLSSTQTQQRHFLVIQ